VSRLADNNKASRRAWGVGLVALSALALGCRNASAPPFSPVSATSHGNVYTLELGALKMVIDAATGARITEFSLNGRNVLTGPSVNATNYGSTYWPSPQSSWCSAGAGCWPPIAAIDSQPYTGTIDAATNAIQLASGTASLAGFPGSAVTVTKQFKPIPGSGAVDVTFTLTNASPSVTISFAPWQVSRVQAAGGLTFFASPAGSVTYLAGTDPAFKLTKAQGALWYDFMTVASNSKAFADGAGGMAHVTRSGLLYLLSYPDIQPGDAAPGEAEVELFTGPGSDYVELESQGRLTSVAPGDTLAWTVRWKLRQLPPGTDVAAGSAALASLARAQLAP
jgi:hypothetical protein